MVQSNLHVFVSYSHRDRRWLDRIKVHLRPLTRDLQITAWDDTMLSPGARWKEEIKSAVDSADIAILIVSADFLASDFIQNDELPPLLESAEDAGTTILPIVAGPCLFTRLTKLSRFQALNDPSKPLVSLSEGEQEAVFQRLALELHDRATSDGFFRPKSISSTVVTRREDFLQRDTWTKLLKIGDWIFDEEKHLFIGSGMRAYLLSRDEYGDEPFKIETELEFSNFKLPTRPYVGMNAGVVLGWQKTTENFRYINILFTGVALLVEKIGFYGGIEVRDFKHITEPIDLKVEAGKRYKLDISITQVELHVTVNGKDVLSVARPHGIIGRVGLRPWRSKIDCHRFVVTASA